MKYTDYLIYVFERYNIKSMVIDSADDDLWIATFEFKDGTKKQYNTSRNNVASYCLKHYVCSARIENDKDRLVYEWKRCAIKLCCREQELNKLLNELSIKMTGIV